MTPARSDWDELTERGQPRGADALIEQLERRLVDDGSPRQPRVGGGRRRWSTLALVATLALTVVVAVALSHRGGGGEQRVAAGPEHWFAEPRFLPPGFSLVFRSGDDHTQILMYRNGAARVAVLDVFSIRGPIDVNAHWPGRTFRSVKIRGHDASLVVASPAAPEDGVRVVSWQERLDLSVHLAVSGPMSDETLLAIANSIDPRSSLPSASPTPSWP